MTGYLAAAGAGTPPAAHYAFKALALARATNLTEARKAAMQYRSMVDANNTLHHTVNAFIALQANDWATAQKELARSGPVDLLAKALRADVLLHKGPLTNPNAIRQAALRQEVATSSVKLDGNPGVDYIKLVAKMHVDNRQRPATGAKEQQQK